MSEQKRRQGDRKMLHLIELYKKEHPEEGDEIDPESVSHWAIAEHKYVPIPISPEKLLRRKISRALKDEYITDPQKREVRKFHFVVEGDGTERHSKAYAIYDAPPEHMRISLAQRRRSALQDVLQLDLDLNSYNDNNKFGATIPQLDYDYNKDVAEKKMPTDYPLEAPDDLDDIEIDEEDGEEDKK